MMKFIKKEWTGSYIEGKMYDTQVISKKEAIRVMGEKGIPADVAEQMLDDLIWEDKTTNEVSSMTYMLGSGLEVGVAY